MQMAMWGFLTAWIFLILVNSVSKSMKLQCERGQGNKENALMYVSVVLLCAAWVICAGCQNKGSLSSWTSGFVMEHNTFGFQVPGDEENERKQWSTLHAAISFSTIFFCVIALAQPYENDWEMHLVFMLSLKMSFPYFWDFLFCF